MKRIITSDQPVVDTFEEYRGLVSEVKDLPEYTNCSFCDWSLRLRWLARAVSTYDAERMTEQIKLFWEELEVWEDRWEHGWEGEFAEARERGTELRIWID